MAETLLAILLVTTSAKGSSSVYWWPPNPTSSPRFTRAKPDESLNALQIDNPWRASHPSDPLPNIQPQNDPESEWKRPGVSRDRSMSFSSDDSRPSSGRNSPSQDGFYSARHSHGDEYLFGYSSEFLANLLCPQRAMCHQKFELLADDLVFIGHPVSVEEDGAWRFKPEKPIRGRGNRRDSSGSPVRPVLSEKPPTTPSSWLQRFHFVMVLDVPDPSSSASGNITKYFDLIYEQVAFPVTAVLFKEQVESNFVEQECDILGALKDSCSAQGDDFNLKALEACSIAPAMKTLYEALKSSSIAYITLHDLPLELQLPPYLDVLLHSEEENDTDFNQEDDDDDQGWGSEMSFGYRLPSLTPWKALLLLDDGPEGLDPYANLRRSLIGTGDRSLVEGLLKFLELASVSVSLGDMASLVDWDLETQVFPTVRWLVHHRRAKVVDLVHHHLKTSFMLPPKFDKPLAELTTEFDRTFSHSGVPSLPQLLAAISTSSSSNSNMFTSVVKSKDATPLYHDVVLWMLKRDMLITLHLRIRIIATVKLKERVKFAAKDRKRRKGHSKLRNQLDADAEHSPPGFTWLSLSPQSARRYSRQSSVAGSRNHSRLSELVLQDDSGESSDSNNLKRAADDDETPDSDEVEDPGSDNEPSLINDPGRATPLQRRWLTAMSEGKDPHIVRRFEQINQYFDGKRTDDEIMYRADIRRPELREIILIYEEHLLTFLHPS